MKDYILALDQGTTSSRALLFDHQARIVSQAQQEFRQYFPQPGWVEHDPMEIWNSQLAVAHECLRRAQVSARQIRAIGIANQRETTVLWERASGRPLAPAIVWQDRRTAEFCEQLAAQGLSEKIQQKTGLRLDPYFSATKLKWLLDHIPQARQRAENNELAFGTIDSWLLWQLSAGRCHITDISNASRTLLYDIHAQCWDEDLLQIFDIPENLLPTVVSSSALYGHTDMSLFDVAIPLAGMAGDQQAATFGQACLNTGMAKNTYGTGCFMLLNTGHQARISQQHLLSTVAWKMHEQTSYALEGSVFMAGAIVQWLRDGLGIIQQSSEVEALASSITDTGGVQLIPAFTGLGAPWWQAQARASLLGMNRGTTRAHIARAALEAIAQQTADVLAAMQQDAALPLTELRVDGGAANNNLLMQFQADLLNVSVLRPKLTETTASGAAFLAGLATGYWQSTDETASLWQLERRFEPCMSAEQRAELRARWQHAVRLTMSYAASPP